MKKSIVIMAAILAAISAGVASVIIHKKGHKTCW